MCHFLRWSRRWSLCKSQTLSCARTVGGKDTWATNHMCKRSTQPNANEQSFMTNCTVITTESTALTHNQDNNQTSAWNETRKQIPKIWLVKKNQMLPPQKQFSSTSQHSISKKSFHPETAMVVNETLEDDKPFLTMMNSLLSVEMKLAYHGSDRAEHLCTIRFPGRSVCLIASSRLFRDGSHNAASWLNVECELCWVCAQTKHQIPSKIALNYQ